MLQDNGLSLSCLAVVSVHFSMMVPDSGRFRLGSWLVTTECLITVKCQESNHNRSTNTKKRSKYSRHLAKTAGANGDEHQDSGHYVQHCEYHIVDKHRQRTVDEGTELVQPKEVDDEDDDGEYESGGDHEVVEAVHAIIPAVSTLVLTDDPAHADNRFQNPQNSNPGLDVIRV